MSFPVPLSGANGRAVERELGGVLSDRVGPIHEFARTIRVEPKSEHAATEPLVTFLEPVELRPGKYQLTTVLSDSTSATPEAAKIECDVPAVPSAKSFLVGPILARRAGGNVVVSSGPTKDPRRQRVAPGDTIGRWNEFEPLLVQHIDDPGDLVVLTVACVADNEHASRSRTVLRRFLSADGHVLGTLDPLQVDIAQGKGIRCRTVVDVLPSPSTIEGGEYSFDASLAPHSGSDPDWAEVRFSVGSSKLSSECSAPPKP